MTFNSPTSKQPKTFKLLSRDFFADDTLEVAKKLLGKILEYNGVKGSIVETEAYTNDEASHGFKKTKRSELMHNTFGYVYVYFTYGMYFCLNFTTEKNSVGAVLIRALEPLEGIEMMQERRKTNNIHNLCSGPGKLCQALGITKALNGEKIQESVKIFDMPDIPTEEIIASPRIGISKAKNLQWRFFIQNNSFVIGTGRDQSL